MHAFILYSILRTLETNTHLCFCELGKAGINQLKSKEMLQH